MSAPPEAGRRWLAQYPAGLPADIDVEHDDVLSLFRTTVARHADRPAILYFDGVLTFADLDARSDAFAAHLAERGFGPGHRLAVYLQNDPAFVVALLGAWKAGGGTVAMNPMYRRREVEYLLRDSGATAIVCLDEGYDEVVRGIVEDGGTDLREVVLVSPRDDQTRDDARVLPEDGAHPAGVPRLADIVAERRVAPDVPARDEIAMLMYTSGTTGHPKGAVITHRSLAFGGQVYRDWIGIGPDDRILGIAPLFHITGLVGHVIDSLLTGAALILVHRFTVDVVLDAVREHRPTFSVGSVTAFNALASSPRARKEDFASLRAVYSGGAPIAPALAAAIRERTGFDLHNLYGMTETHGPAIGVPLGASAPVDPVSGALSIGVPMFNTRVRIVDDGHAELPPGEIGEILVAGPQVVPAYWNRPEDSAERIVDDEIATGDVGFMDADGWCYLVDRKTDMINASGYKVWPREVEDVLYSHPAVHEAAVVGVPDGYRGETVKAYVVLEPGSQASADDIVAFCRTQMAAYKYPRVIEFCDDLPKSVTGKILRRELRDAAG